ncbi:hypothetical protein F3K50_15750 [Pseudomonas marginalis]|nr:hypothetical protein F3K50_15750 [Pseudomonas marginalis]
MPPPSIQPSTYCPDIAVPIDQRVFGARDLFSLWFSLGIGLMVLQTGALLAWLGGISTYHLLANLYPDIGATLPALALTGLLQFILGRAFSGARAPVQA